MSGAGSKGKDIPRVNVADLAAGLGARFSNSPPTPDTQPSHTSPTTGTPASHETRTDDTPSSDTSAPAQRTTTQRARRSSRPPEPAPASGNIRRSLYTHTTAFEALDAAAARIAAATGGLVPKHDAIARLIHAGVARTDEVIAEITRDLTARLTQPTEGSRTDR